MSGRPMLTPVSQGTSLVVTPHPITLDGQRIYHAERALLVPGERLSNFLDRHEVYAGQQWRVSIGGVEVAECHWHLVKPKHGHLIEARRVPQGDVLKVVAVVALAYFTLGAGGLGAGGLFASGGLIGGGSLVAGAAFMVGSLVLNKLLPAKKPAQNEPPALANNTNSPSYTLQAAKNRARQFETMGLMLGQPYVVPDLAAQPYTYFANGEQYLWQLFHFGLNCASVDTLRIGQTAIENYQGVQILREGFDAGNTGLPDLTTNVDSLAGGLLVGAGAYVTRTSSPDTIVLSIDVECSLYEVNAQTGAYELRLVTFALEYRAVGAVYWEGFQLDGAHHITVGNSASKPLRLTYERAVPQGQYEVRMQKVSADVVSGGAQNVVSWLALKSFQIDGGDYAGQARLAVKVQASGQLNGALDEVNAQGTAKPMPYWNGAAWVTATNRGNGLSNPGAQILLIARGIYDGSGRLIAGLGLDDAEIDIEGLKGFMEFCAAKNFTFDLMLQENMSVADLIDTIAAAGMGSRSEHTGKLGVIWFSDDQPVEGVLNMTTMKAKSFSVDYAVQETADEIEFQYFDRDRGNTWKSVRVKAPGVVVPQRTATQKLQGVTTESHAAVLARFSMGQNVYQRKTISTEVDLEHMTFRRGTVMALSHDLTQWGYGGRVQGAHTAGGLVTLDLDAVVPAVSPAGAVTRYVGLRIPGEAQYRIFPVTAFVGTAQQLTLATAWPGGVPLPGDAADNPAHDTLWIYDFKQTPGQQLRVSDIKPQGNMDGAKVELVPDSPEFWNYVWNGAYTPPPNTSLLGQGPPVVTRAVVTEQLGRQGNTYYTELTVTYEVTGRLEYVELWGAVSNGALQKLGTSRAQSISWRGGVSEDWTLEVRPYGATRLGAPYNLTYHVLGLDELPETPSGIALTQSAVFCKPTSFAVDVVGFMVRTTPGRIVATPADFRRGTLAHQGLITEFPWQFTTRLYGVQTVMVVTVDSSGNWSGVASDSLDFGQPSDQNIGQTFDYRAAGWLGTYGAATVVAGDLLADADPASDLDLLDDWDGEPNLDATLLLALVYVTRDFVPAYGGGTLVLDVATSGPQSAVEYRISGSTTNNLDALANLDTEANLDGDNSGWAPWPGALLALRGVGYAFRISIEGGSQQPKVTALTAKLALQRATQTFPPMAIAAAGTRLSPAAGLPPVTWVTVQSVTMLPEADGSGAVAGRYIDLSPTLGPLVQQLTSAGATVNSRATSTVGGLIDV